MSQPVLLPADGGQVLCVALAPLLGSFHRERCIFIGCLWSAHTQPEPAFHTVISFWSVDQSTLLILSWSDENSPPLVLVLHGISFVALIRLPAYCVFCDYLSFSIPFGHDVC